MLEPIQIWMRWHWSFKAPHLSESHPAALLHWLNAVLIKPSSISKSMAITISVLSPPSTIGVLVDFYDGEERLEFETRGIKHELPAVIEIPVPDFCAYYLYYKKRPNVLGYQNHDEVAQQWAKALVEFEGQFVFENKSIRAVSAKSQSTGTTERLGEAIGLSVVSNLHQLHQADWIRIPVSNKKKTFDFEYTTVASGITQLIQVEAKGSITVDGTIKSSSISAHKRSIKSKKQQNQSKGLYYGTIGVLSEAPNSTATCWLVDPPPSTDGDPSSLKVLSRLEYIAELISYLGVRSNLASSLQTRLATLRKLADFSSLDRVQLFRGNGKEFKTGLYDSSQNNRSSWFSGKCLVQDDSTGGQIFRVQDKVLFIGIREELIDYAARQDFSEIRQFKFNSQLTERVVECVISKGRFGREFSELALKWKTESVKRNYLRFNLSGPLYETQSGLGFGLFEFPVELLGSINL